MTSWAMTPPEASLWNELSARVTADPFNLAATLIFGIAILHTFAAPMFLRMAHAAEARHAREGEVCFSAQVLHFLGEVEAVFHQGDC